MSERNETTRSRRADDDRLPEEECRRSILKSQHLENLSLWEGQEILERIMASIWLSEGQLAIVVPCNADDLRPSKVFFGSPSSRDSGKVCSVNERRAHPLSI